MGCGSWDSTTYDKVTKSKIDSGTTFAYSAAAAASGYYKVHDSLNIKGSDGPAIRESRDSTEHPESTPIIVGFDETGSMGGNPAIIQTSLKELFGMLVSRGIVSDPQVAIAAYGDMYCDEAPVQFGQFESDNRIDNELDNIVIEHNGGSNPGETSAVIPYYAAKYVKTDAWEKRRKKGYLFLIGDECSLDLTKAQLHEFLGENVQGNVSAADAYNMALEKWNIYFLLINDFAAEYQNSRDKYASYIGEDHVIELQDASTVAACIASLIALNEKTADRTTIGTELAKAGFDKDVINRAISEIGTIAVYDNNNANTITANNAGHAIAEANTDYADLVL